MSITARLTNYAGGTLTGDALANNHGSFDIRDGRNFSTAGRPARQQRHDRRWRGQHAHIQWRR